MKDLTNNPQTALIISTVKNAFPAFNGGGATYNQISKLFLSAGWQSAAGNVYQEGVRISSNLVVKYSIGHGYYHTFMNGICLYAYNGKELKLIASDQSYYNFWWDEYNVKSQTVNLLSGVIENQCRIAGCKDASREEIRKIASAMVEDTIKYTEAIGNYALASGNNTAGLLG